MEISPHILPLYEGDFDDNNLYVVPGECTNCGWTGVMLLPYGDPAPTGEPEERAAVACKTCGVEAVVKPKVERR